MAKVLSYQPVGSQDGLPLNHALCELVEEEDWLPSREVRDEIARMTAFMIRNYGWTIDRANALNWAERIGGTIDAAPKD